MITFTVIAIGLGIPARLASPLTPIAQERHRVRSLNCWPSWRSEPSTWRNDHVQ